MGRISAATSAVKTALDELGTIVTPRPRLSRTWDADLTALGEAWAELKCCLHDAAELIKKPQVGQGIESAWLRAVCIAVADVDPIVQRWCYGRGGPIRYSDSELKWLFIDLRHAGDNLSRGTYAWKGDVSGLLAPDESPLSRLRRLATGPNAQLWFPREPAHFLPPSEHDYWEQQNNLRAILMQQFGNGILQAVDSLAIDAGLLQDGNFLRCIVNSFDYPAYFPLEMQRQNRVEGFLELIDLLEPNKHRDSASQDGGDSERSAVPPPTAAVTITVNGKTKTYSSPRLYERDKWIYENIPLYDCHTLSKMIQKEARAKKWKIVVHRNSFKNSADRYADFHEIPKRRFPDARALGSA